MALEGSNPFDYSLSNNKFGGDEPMLLRWSLNP
jgi:hypothetical protein